MNSVVPASPSGSPRHEPEVAVDAVTTLASNASAEEKDNLHKNPAVDIFAYIESRLVFQNTTLFIIVINAGWIFIDVEWNHTSLRKNGRLPLEPGSTVVENLFCVYFTFELVVRFLAFRKVHFCLWDAWFVFDSALVLFMVIETWVLPLVELISGAGGDGGGVLSNFSSFRLLRLLRLTRMARVMRFFPELMTLVKGMARAMESVFFVLLFLIMMTYVGAILFTAQLGIPGPDPAPKDDAEPTAADLFSDMGTSIMTLFTNGVLGDNLADTLFKIKDESLIMMWLFAGFMVISGLTLLNMLIGVLCQVIEDTSREEHETQQVASLRACLIKAFNEVDTSHDGEIAEAEWNEIGKSPEVRESLRKLGVPEKDMDDRLHQMSVTLFGTQSQRISVIHPEHQVHRGLALNEFCDRIIELRWDTPAAMMDVQLFNKQYNDDCLWLHAKLEKIGASAKALTLEADDAPENDATSQGNSLGPGGGPPQPATPSSNMPLAPGMVPDNSVVPWTGSEFQTAQLSTPSKKSDDWALESVPSPSVGHVSPPARGCASEAWRWVPDGQPPSERGTEHDIIRSIPTALLLHSLKARLERSVPGQPFCGSPQELS